MRNYYVARLAIGVREMTSQLRLQHPVEPVVNDYAILLQFHICCEDTKKSPYLCEYRESFVII